jgi:HEAT repeat protein
MTAEALGKLRDYRAVMPLLNLLRDESDLARANSILALGRIGNPVATPFILRALDDSEPDIRAAAVTALAGLGATAAISRLRRIARPWPLSREPRVVKIATRAAVATLLALRSREPAGTEPGESS